MSNATTPVTVDSLLNQAKTLTDAQRAELANRLFGTLPAPPEPPQTWDSEEVAEAAWQEELERRLNDVANGTAELIDGEQVFAELRARLREKRKS